MAMWNTHIVRIYAAVYVREAAGRTPFLTAVFRTGAGGFGSAVGAAHTFATPSATRRHTAPTRRPHLRHPRPTRRMAEYWAYGPVNCPRGEANEMEEM